MIFGGELDIFICLNQDIRDLRIYGLRHASLSGCYWMIFSGDLDIFICLNQDVQDLRIYRMLLDDFWWGVGYFYLSEI
jgi:hypothetical protein